MTLPARSTSIPSGSRSVHIGDADNCSNGVAPITGTAGKPAAAARTSGNALETDESLAVLGRGAGGRLDTSVDVGTVNRLVQGGRYCRGRWSVVGPSSRTKALGSENGML